MYLAKNSKSKFYQIIFFRNGKRTTASTKTTNKKEAQKFLANFNPDTPEIIEVKPNDIPLKKFYAEYLQHMELSKSKTYLKSVRLSFNQFILFAGDISLSHITIRLIDSFINTTFKRAEYSAALYYRTLKAAFSTAENWEYIQSNPFKKIKAPKTQNKLPVFI
ncbi:MAG: phage integrase SAM-like domain-containing protein, partial [Melioribacteraceae bacterium]|nr:phage integrase SAM-like domain-containing protein [Melioribacteraceae bacterium]